MWKQSGRAQDVNFCRLHSKHSRHSFIEWVWQLYAQRRMCGLFFPPIIEHEAKISMKVIIPTAGLGTRLRPHTYSKPKPLVSVAGKPVLGHILDTLSQIAIDELIFITGYLGNQIEDYVHQHYTFPTRFIEQTELKGQAHAIYLAREVVSGPTLILFVDTIFEADLTRLNQIDADGVIYVKEVQDPRR